MSLRVLASQAAVALKFRSLSGLSSRIVPFSRAYSAERKYLKSHEWVSVEGDVGTVGISEFAQNELGEVVFVDMPESGSEVEAGKTFGVVESVKAASDIYSPISGTVVEANTELTSSPGLVNSGPFTEGWMVKVKLSAKADLDSLMDETAYKAHCDEVAH